MIEIFQFSTMLCLTGGFLIWVHFQIKKQCKVNNDEIRQDLHKLEEKIEEKFEQVDRHVKVISDNAVTLFNTLRNDKKD